MKRKISLRIRVIRGGSWPSDDPAYLAASARDWLDPTYRYDFLGFRLARKV